MIRSFRHKGLKRLFEEDDARGVSGEHAEKVSNILATLDAASALNHLDLPGFRLHALHGELKGHWAITVRANWRVVFRFIEPDVFDVDYIDYH